MPRVPAAELFPRAWATQRWWPPQYFNGNYNAPWEWTELLGCLGKAVGSDALCAQGGALYHWCHRWMEHSAQEILLMVKCTTLVSPGTQTLSFHYYIQSITKSAFFQPQKHFPTSTFTLRLRGWNPEITSHLDNCKTLDRLRYVQNSAARVLLRPWQHITSTLIHLHWLLIKPLGLKGTIKIEFIIIVIIAQALHDATICLWMTWTGCCTIRLQSEKTNFPVCCLWKQDVLQDINFNNKINIYWPIKQMRLNPVREHFFFDNCIYFTNPTEIVFLCCVFILKKYGRYFNVYKELFCYPEFIFHQ